MKQQCKSLKWIRILGIPAIFVSLVLALPSAFAQGENLLTPTPITFSIPMSQQANGFQLMDQLQPDSPLGGEWSAQVNLSDTPEDSIEPQIAADSNGVLHFVWVETINGKREIFYSRIDGLAQSIPVNVSKSSTIDSDRAKFIVDTSGTAHIVWQENDDEILYSKCNEAGCSTNPVSLSDGDPCSVYYGNWMKTYPSIGMFE